MPGISGRVDDADAGILNAGSQFLLPADDLGCVATLRATATNRSLADTLSPRRALPFISSITVGAVSVVETKLTCGKLGAEQLAGANYIEAWRWHQLCYA